jgi:hypothetical protein
VGVVFFEALKYLLFADSSGLLAIDLLLTDFLTLLGTVAAFSLFSFIEIGDFMITDD